MHQVALVYTTQCSFNSAITIFSKAHDISCLHMQNFTIKRVLAKTFSSVSNEMNAILLTQIQVSHVENKHLCQFIEKQQRKGKKNKRTIVAIAKLFLLHTNAKRFTQL